MNKKGIIFFLIFIIAAAGIFFHIVHRSPEKESGIEIKNKEVLTKINVGNIKTLDPHYQYDNVSSEIYVNVYENLISFDEGDINQFKAMLAEEVPTVDNDLIQNDGRTYIFPIREDVKFHEGGYLTPEDVRYSFLRALINDREGAQMWMLYEVLYNVRNLTDITNMLVNVEEPSTLTEEQSRVVYEHLIQAIEVDGDNVIFHLPEPYSPFLSIIAHNNGLGAVLNKKWCIEQGAWDGEAETIARYYNSPIDDNSLYEKTNGTGPFKLKRWDKGESITLERNEDYWREKANLETVVIEMIDEWSKRKLQLENGEADIIYVEKQYMDQVYAMENIKVITGLPNLYTGYGLMNWDIDTEDNIDVHSGKLDGNGVPGDFFNDIHVRKAFSYAMDYDLFINEVLKRDGQQSRGPIPEPILGFEKESPVYTMDLKKAEEEFKKAFNGKLWDEGFEITILYSSGNAVRKAAVDILKNSIEGINDRFNINVRGVQWTTYLDRLAAGKFTFGFIGWGADYVDPHSFVVPFLHSDGTFGSFKGENYVQFARNYNINWMVSRGVEITDQDERKDVYKELQELVYEHATDIYLYQPTDQIVMRDWVQGWEYDPVIFDAINFYFLYKDNKFLE